MESEDEDKPQTNLDKRPVGTSSANSEDEQSKHRVALAQSTIKRLQTAVKEKEDMIVALQRTVAATYQAALQEQAHEQGQLEALHQVFLANGARRGPSNQAANLHSALQALARQEDDPNSTTKRVTSTLIKAVARLMDDHLQQLGSSHETETKELNRSLEFYKKRNQVLETHLAEERKLHQIHINNIVEPLQEQAQLEALHQVFLANNGRRGQSNRAATLHSALQALSRQEEKGDTKQVTLIKVVARLMDDHVQQLDLSHETKTKELNESLEFFKDRSQVLETQLQEERMLHQSHISDIVEEVRKKIPQDKQQQRNEVEKYQNQLRNKESKIKALREEVKSLELRLTSPQQQENSQREENGVSPSKFAKLRARVSILSEQLREAKLISMEGQLAHHANNEVIKQSSEETSCHRTTNNTIHRLAVQLAKYRQKEKFGNNPPLSQNIHEAFDSSKIVPEVTFLDYGGSITGYKLGSLEDTLTAEIHNLQVKLKKCKGDVKKNEDNCALYKKMMRDCKKETHQCRLSMLENKEKLRLEKCKEEKSKQLNSNLLHCHKEMKDSYIELQKKVQQHDLTDVEVQVQEEFISRLEMDEKSQTISDLKTQLETQDDELNYLHGQLAIQKAIEDEQDERITKEQMAQDNTNVDKLFVKDLQMANEKLSKVCRQYEELLQRQAKQLGISFEPLQNE